MSPKELRELRNKANLTQQQLADLLNVDRMTINRWEAGKTKLDRITSIAIRAVLRPLLEK
jgi:transcriptional regulator with XRE-family HTH domain